MRGRDAPPTGLVGRGGACGGGRFRGGSGGLGATGTLSAPPPRPPLPPTLVEAVAGAPVPITRGDTWPRAGAGATGGTGTFAPAAGATLAAVWGVAALLDGSGGSGAVGGSAEGVASSGSASSARLDGSGGSGAVGSSADGVASSGSGAATMLCIASGAGAGAGVGGRSGGSGSGSVELAAAARCSGPSPTAVEGREEISGGVATTARADDSSLGGSLLSRWLISSSSLLGLRLLALSSR